MDSARRRYWSALQLHFKETAMRLDDLDESDRITMCKLEDGSVVKYDGCAEHEASDYYTPDKWVFIGTGVIYSINGVPHNSTTPCWFYRLQW